MCALNVSDYIVGDTTVLESNPVLLMAYAPEVGAGDSLKICCLILT